MRRFLALLTTVGSAKVSFYISFGDASGNDVVIPEGYSAYSRRSIFFSGSSDAHVMGLRNPKGPLLVDGFLTNKVDDRVVGFANTYLR